MIIHQEIIQHKARQWNHQKEEVQTATTPSLEVSKALTPVAPVPSSSLLSKFWMYERCFGLVKSANTEECECLLLTKHPQSSVKEL